MTGLYLIVGIAGERVALDCAMVDAVVTLGPVVPAPLAETQVLGLTALRSKVATVIDPTVSLLLHSSLELPERAVVTTIGGHAYAVVVEAVEDAVALTPQPLAAGLAVAGGWSQVARGMVEFDGHPLLIVDLASLVAGFGANMSVAA